MDYELVRKIDPTWVDAIYLTMEEYISPCMRASHFIAAVNSFISISNIDVYFMNSILNGKCSVAEICQQIYDSKNDYIILPSILNSKICHMTLIIIDNIKKKIVYYNPTGESPLHEARNIFNIGTSTGILALLCCIKSKLDMYTILYSARKDQLFYEIFTCGFYAKQFIERYVLFPELVPLVPIGM